MKEFRIFLMTVSLLASSAFGEDISVPGVGTYSNYVVRRVEPDGITIKHTKGLTKLFFRELPSDICAKYGADPTKAKEYQRKKAQAQAKRDAEIAETNARRQKEWDEHAAKIEQHDKHATQPISRPRAVLLTKDRVVRRPPMQRKTSYNVPFSLGLWDTPETSSSGLWEKIGTTSTRFEKHNDPPFINTDPRAPWNSIHRDNPRAPWNSSIHRDNPRAPWNSVRPYRESLDDWNSLWPYDGNLDDYY